MKLIINLKKDTEDDLRNCMLLIEKRIHEIKESNKAEEVQFKNYKLNIKEEDANIIKLVKVIYNELIDKFGKSVPLGAILMKFPRKEHTMVVDAIETMMKKGEIFQPNKDFIAKI